METPASMNFSMEDSNITVSLLNPVFFMDKYLASIHILFAALGVPFNLLVAGIIIFVKRLHSPRNFIWLGIGMSNIFILISFVLEVCFSKMDSSQSWFYFSKMSGLPFGSLIINFHLSLLKRYVSIHYHSWHKKNVTNQMIVASQIAQRRKCA